VITISRTDGVQLLTGVKIPILSPSTDLALGHISKDWLLWMC